MSTMSYPHNICIYLKGGDHISFGVENQESVSDYILGHMAILNSVVSFKNDQGILHALVRTADISGFQFWPRNHEGEELVKMRMDLEKLRLQAEERQLKQIGDSDSWRG